MISLPHKQSVSFDRVKPSKAALKYDLLSDSDQRDGPQYGEIFEDDYSYHLDLAPYHVPSYVWGHEVSPHSLSTVHAAGGLISNVSLGATSTRHFANSVLSYLAGQSSTTRSTSIRPAMKREGVKSLSDGRSLSKIAESNYLAGPRARRQRLGLDCDALHGSGKSESTPTRAYDNPPQGGFGFSMWGTARNLPYSHNKLETISDWLPVAGVNGCVLRHHILQVGRCPRRRRRAALEPKSCN